MQALHGVEDEGEGEGELELLVAAGGTGTAASGVRGDGEDPRIVVGVRLRRVDRVSAGRGPDSLNSSGLNPQIRLPSTCMAW